jgi:hypothetical protein
MPGVFRRTLPVLLPLAALLLADVLVPRSAMRGRRLAGMAALAALVIVGARHTGPLLGRSLPSGSRDALTAFARDSPASALVIADRGLPSHLALALDFSFGRSALAADFVFRDAAPDRTAALTRLIAHAGLAKREVFFLGSSTPSRFPEALPAGWTPYQVRSVPLSYSTLERRRGAWPSQVRDVRDTVTVYQLVPPERHVPLPLHVEVGGLDLALSRGGWQPAEVMLDATGRWTGAAAAIRWPTAACAGTGPLVLRIRAATLRPAKLIQPRVRLAVNGVQIGELTPVDSAFRVYALGLPLAAVRQVCTAPSTFSIESGTFVPARDAGSPDTRELGLAVDWVELTPDAGRQLLE